MPTIGYVLIAITAIAAGIWLAAHLEEVHKRNRTTKATVEHRPLPKFTEPAVVPAPVEVQAAPPIKDNGRDRLKDRLRERKAVNQDLASSIASAMTEFGDRVTMDDAIRAALQVGYSPNDVATYMAQRQYQLKEIATMLSEENSFTVNELGDIIMPLVKGDTVAARADTTFEIVKDTLDVSDDDEDLEQLPVHLGCSSEEAAAIVYRNTDLTLGVVLKALKLCGSPEVAARIAKEVEVDLSEDDEYGALREDDENDFDVVAAILKACGEKAETIIAAENTHDEFGDDEFDEIFSSLSTAGFTNAEIMSGISDAGLTDDNMWAAIVKAALERKVPMDEVVAFLKKEDIDSDGLDEEMRELEFEILTRVDVLHALLHSDKKSATQETADLQSK